MQLKAPGKLAVEGGLLTVFDILWWVAKKGFLEEMMAYHDRICAYGANGTHLGGVNPAEPTDHADDFTYRHEAE